MPSVGRVRRRGLRRSGTENRFKRSVILYRFDGEGFSWRSSPVGVDLSARAKMGRPNLASPETDGQKIKKRSKLAISHLAIQVDQPRPSNSVHKNRLNPVFRSTAPGTPCSGRRGMTPCRSHCGLCGLRQCSNPDGRGFGRVEKEVLQGEAARLRQTRKPRSRGKVARLVPVRRRTWQ